MKTLALTFCAMLALISVAQARPVCRDRDNNPPGWRGGRGTNWENPPGRRGGPGFGTRWGDNDNNPPGCRGGAGNQLGKPARTPRWSRIRLELGRQ